MTPTRSITLFVDPPSYHFERDRLFDVSRAQISGDRILEPYIHTRERLAALGVATHTADLLESGEVEARPGDLFVTVGMHRRYRKVHHRHGVLLSAFLVPECPIVNPPLYEELYDASHVFKRMYSFSEDDALRPFLRGPVTFRPFRYPYPFDRVDDGAWGRRERRLLVMINGNKLPPLKTRELYTERLRALEYFGDRGEIDLYGVGWDGPPFRVGDSRVPRAVRRLGYLAEKQWDRLRPGRDPLLTAARRAYQGPVVSKSDTLAGYVFSICFENMVLEGWVTEKIFDCLRAGTIPVYLGAPDIERWVWPECFVDMRHFAGYEELREFLHGLSPDEIQAYREAGRRYFASEEFRPFTKQAFAEIFQEIVREDAGVELER